MAESAGNWEVQQALYGALHESISVPVYDEVPASATRNYVVIGEDESSTDSIFKESDGRSISLSIEIWSKESGFSTAKIIAEEIVSVLKADSFALPNFDIYEMDIDVVSSRSNRNRESVERLVSVDVDMVISKKGV